jgi:hypothetical protein
MGGRLHQHRYRPTFKIHRHRTRVVWSSDPGQRPERGVVHGFDRWAADELSVSGLESGTQGNGHT